MLFSTLGIARRLLHVELLLDGAIQEGSLHVEMVKVHVFRRHHGEQDVQCLVLPLPRSSTEQLRSIELRPNNHRVSKQD
jgi:hypothetical protein